MDQILQPDPARQPVGPQPERVEATCQQEQFIGALPQRNERPLAELLRERLAEAHPAPSSMLFIP